MDKVSVGATVTIMSQRWQKVPPLSKTPREPEIVDTANFHSWRWVQKSLAWYRSHHH